MYKSPIEIICGDIQKQIDNDIYRVTQKYDIKVDKNELIQALQYDRDQYHKGYADGVKEFAERLKEYKFQSSEWSHGEHPFVVEETDIDELVEEMVGADNA